MAIMVDTTLYDNRRMRLIGAVCPRKVVSEFVATSIVVLNIAKLRRVLIYFNSAKHSNSLQRVLDRRLDELRMDSSKNKLLGTRSRFFNTP